MIKIIDQQIYFQGSQSSFWMQVNQHQHLEQLYYGKKVLIQEVDVLENKNRVQFGNLVNIHDGYSLDTQLLEYSSAGKGDFRPAAIALDNDSTGFVSDLRVKDYWINETIELPTDYFVPRIDDSSQQLVVKLFDDYHEAEILLYYTFYPNQDVLCRHVTVINKAQEVLNIDKLMSLQLDVLENNYQVLSLNGTWGKEAQIKIDDLVSGTLVHQSVVGSSSSYTNPGLMLLNQTEAYGFNLMYSGNHYNSVSVHIDDSCRVLMGLNPNQFKIRLSANESFSSPVAIMTYSNHSRKGVTQNFHAFIKKYIIREAPFQKPITYNHWEATFFDYNHKKLMALAQQAADLGMDLFVIDDGWFGKRNDDFSSLGDYNINHSKFPKGIKHTIDKIKSLGLKVGLWFEPEMISEDSDLYRKHPQWVIGQADKPRAKGRNQWILDLCQTDVQDYIIKQVSFMIDSTGVDYVKWDMNRNHSDQYSIALDNQNEFDVRYQQGLVRVLKEIFYPRQHLFLEMCASGGNRFDLGMLSVAQQIWTSDNTDAMDRLRIQEGTATFYPLTSISNHVSGKVNAQTLRHNPLSTRFNVALFGAVGYELDLTICSKAELKEIKHQIKIAKQFQELVLNGQYQVLPTHKEERVIWQVSNGKEALVGLFQEMNHGLQAKEKLRVLDLEDEKMYLVKSLSQRLLVARFGELIKHIADVKFDPYGLVMHQMTKNKTIDDGDFKAIASGGLLSSGILLNEIFMGTAHHPELRIWGDFGSTVYYIKETNYEDVKEK